MSLEEEVARLREENQALGAALQETREQLSQTQEQLQAALARIEELEKGKTPPPSFVKANVKKRAETEKKPRKKREAQHNRAAAFVAHPDQRTSLAGVSSLSPPLRRPEPGASARGHRGAAGAVCGNHRTPHLQRLVFGLPTLV